MIRKAFVKSSIGLSNMFANIAFRADRETQDATAISYANAMTGVRTDMDIGASWKTLDLHRNELFELGTTRIIDTILNISDAANKALWDLILFCNPGFSYTVDPPENKMYIDNFISRLNYLYGDFNGLLDTLFASIFIGGAYFYELINDTDMMLPINLAILDPLSARFVYKEVKEAGGGHNVLAQQQRYGLKILNRNTSYYSALHALPKQPLGRPMISPGIYASAFLLTIIQDIRRVIAHQGTPRYHFKIEAEELTKLIQSLHPNLIGNDERIAAFIVKHQQQIKKQLKNLGPTDDFIGLSTLDISLPRGSSTGFRLDGVEGYVKLLERSIVRGFKTTKLLMGIDESSPSTHSNSEMAVYFSGVESLQYSLAKLLNRTFENVLHIQGKQGTVTSRFTKQRISDKKVLAETEQIAIDNIIKKRDADLINHEQAVEDAEGLRIPFYLGEN